MMASSTTMTAVANGSTGSALQTCPHCGNSGEDLLLIMGPARFCSMCGKKVLLAQNSTAMGDAPNAAPSASVDSTETHPPSSASTSTMSLESHTTPSPSRLSKTSHNNNNASDARAMTPSSHNYHASTMSQSDLTAPLNLSDLPDSFSDHSRQNSLTIASAASSNDSASSPARNSNRNRNSNSKSNDSNDSNTSDNHTNGFSRPALSSTAHTSKDLSSSSSSSLSSIAVSTTANGASEHSPGMTVHSAPISTLTPGRRSLPASTFSSSDPNANAQSLGSETGNAAKKQRHDTTPARLSAPANFSTDSGMHTTLTRAEMKALYESIQKQFEVSVAKEQQLLNMERRDLEKAVTTLKRERSDLLNQLDDQMKECANLLEDLEKQKSSFVADVDILETELRTARAHLERESREKDSLARELNAISAALDQKTRAEADVRDACAKLGVELEQMRQKYETLKTTATEKLKASATEFMSVRQREQEKDLLLREIRRELEAAHEKNTTQQNRLKEAEESCTKLQAQVAQLTHERKLLEVQTINLKATFSASTSSANEYKAKLDEQSAIAARYKEQVLEQRERVRMLEAAAVQRDAEMRDSATARENYQHLLHENQSLKSQIFDTMNREARLKERLQSLQSDASNAGVQTAFEAEISRLSSDLSAKVHENAELTAMVETLLVQLEQHQQGHHDEAAHSH